MSEKGGGRANGKPLRHAPPPRTHAFAASPHTPTHTHRYTRNSFNRGALAPAAAGAAAASDGVLGAAAAAAGDADTRARPAARAPPEERRADAAARANMVVWGGRCGGGKERSTHQCLCWSERRPQRFRGFIFFPSRNEEAEREPARAQWTDPSPLCARAQLSPFSRRPRAPTMRAAAPPRPPLPRGPPPWRRPAPPPAATGAGPRGQTPITTTALGQARAPASSDAAVGAAVASRDVGTVLSALSDAASSPRRDLTRATVDAAVAVCLAGGGRRRADAAARAVRAACAAGAPPGRYATFQSVITACIQVREWEWGRNVEGMWREGNENACSRAPHNAPIPTQARLPDRALTTYRSMRDAGLHPNRVTACAVATELSRAAARGARGGAAPALARAALAVWTEDVETDPAWVTDATAVVVGMNAAAEAGEGGRARAILDASRVAPTAAMVNVLIKAALDAATLASVLDDAAAWRVPANDVTANSIVAAHARFGALTPARAALDAALAAGGGRDGWAYAALGAAYVKAGRQGDAEALVEECARVGARARTSRSGRPSSTAPRARGTRPARRPWWTACGRRACRPMR